MVSTDMRRMGQAIRLNRAVEKLGLHIQWLADRWTICKGPHKEDMPASKEDKIYSGDTLSELEAFLMGIRVGTILDLKEAEDE